MMMSFESTTNHHSAMSFDSTKSVFQRMLVNGTRNLVERGELVDSANLSRESGVERLQCADFLLEEFRRGNLSVTPEGVNYRGWVMEVQHSDFGSNWRNV